MNRTEFSSVKIGDVLVITSHGRNKGKQGVVEKIYEDGCLHGGEVYLRPLDCEFEFSKQNNHLHTHMNGLYRWKHDCVAYPKEPSKMKFYLTTMFGSQDISWPTDNFTPTELDVIARFFKELTNNASGGGIRSIAIIDEN